MRLLISVLGPAREEIEDLLNSAIGEHVIHSSTYFEFDTEDSFFTVYPANKQDADNLVNYIWQWIPPKVKKKSTIRFFKARGTGKVRPSLNMRVLDSILWK